MRRGETGQNIRSGCCLGAAGVGCRRLLCFLSLVRSLVPPRVSLSLSLSKLPFPPRRWWRSFFAASRKELLNSRTALGLRSISLSFSFSLSCSVLFKASAPPNQKTMTMTTTEAVGGTLSLSLSRSLKPPYRLALAVEM